MLKKMQALGAAVLCGLFASAACSSSNGNGGPGGSTSGGSGGTAGNAGQGGTAKPGGSAGSGAGNGGKSGGGSGGDTTLGAGGEAGAAPQCPACASGYCFPDGTCVDCMPSDDHCPAGTVCGSLNTCVPGCKQDGTSCASGVCADAHDCQNCIGDSECGGGNLCGDNQCAKACTADQQGTNAGCGAGLTCCGLHCIDEQTDSQNCGICGTSCASGQFCGLAACSDSGAGGAGGADGQSSGACVACHDTVIANICALPKVVVVLDGQAQGDEAQGRAIATALAAQCNPAPTERAVSQTVPDVLNPASGRPVSGAHELLIAAGGSYYSRLLSYADSQNISPISFVFEDQTLKFRNNATQAIVVSRPLSEAHDSHDYFVVQLMRDSTTGSLILNVEGFWLSGTVAATFLVTNGILPSIATYDKAWYVYDWTDKNGDMAPDLDEMTVVDSGT